MLQSNADAWHGLGATQIAVKDYSAAVLSFRKALRLRPNFVVRASKSYLCDPLYELRMECLHYDHH
jgi:hypothetical protein